MTSIGQNLNLDLESSGYLGQQLGIKQTKEKVNLTGLFAVFIYSGTEGISVLLLDLYTN